MKILGKHLYQTISSLLLVMILLIGFGKVTGTGSFKVYYAAAGVVTIAGLSAFCTMKLRGRLLTGVSAAGCLLIAVAVIGPAEIMDFVAGFFAWLLGTPAKDASGAKLYPLIQVFILSAGCFCFELAARRVVWLERIAAGAMLFCLLWDLFGDRKLGHLCVVGIFGYVAMVYVAWTQAGWNKKKSGKERQYMAWILPFLCLYMLLMAVMPAPGQPYDWKFVKEICSSLKETYLCVVQNWGRGKQEDFAGAKTGFSEDGRLFGGLIADNKPVIELQGQKNLKTNVYLVGKIYDTFTGTEWYHTGLEIEDDRILDALETEYAILNYDLDNRGNYVYTTKLTLFYKYFNTGCLFTPLKTWKIAGVDGKMPQYGEEGCNLVFQNSQGYGTGYEVSFFQINVDHPLFYEFLENTGQPDSKLFGQVQKGYLKDNENPYTLEDLERHRRQVYEIYGEPCELSLEVQSYLEEITEGAATDIQKLKAIETALADYTYTLTPGNLPKEITPEQFLDYFLLESRQGYCSYFATAFVLLARAEGIPARYVEGFCVPMEGEKSQTVYTGMAHAWPEAYIDGVGWIPFEPTPGYESIRYTPWEMTDYRRSDFAEYEEESLEQEDVNDSPEQESSMEKAEEGADRGWKIAGYTILLVFLLLTVFIISDKSIRRIRRRAWSMDRLFQAELQRNLQLLALLGCRRKPWETLTELEQRAGVVMTGEESKESKKLRFLHWYEEVLYGDKAVDEFMLCEVQKDREYLEQELKRRSRLGYLYCRIMM